MYKLTQHASITRLSDGASIPADPANRDYEEYLVWLDQGNTPLPTDAPPPPPTVPQQVTRAQGKAALITAGLWDSVVAYVDSIKDATEQQLALVALNDTTHWKRSSPFLNAAAVSLGLTDEQLDDLFQQAAQIEL